MHPSAQFALTACVAASALGALVMCLLVLRYGFWSADDGAGDAPRRTFITRMGHAFAGACFGITAILAVVALALPAAPPVASSAEDQVVSSTGDKVVSIAGDQIVSSTGDEVVAGRIAEVENEVRALDRRVEAAEATIRRGRTEAGRMAARVEDLERSAAALARARRQASESQPPRITPPMSARAVEPPASASRPGTDAVSPRVIAPSPGAASTPERSAPPARQEPPSRRPEPYRPAEKALSIEPSGEPDRTATVAPSVPRETAPAPKWATRPSGDALHRNAAAPLGSGREAGASAVLGRPARDPDAPYSWDEGVEEARRLGREIKATFTKFGRKVRDLLDD